MPYQKAPNEIGLLLAQGGILMENEEKKLTELTKRTREEPAQRNAAQPTSFQEFAAYQRFRTDLPAYLVTYNSFAGANMRELAMYVSPGDLGLDGFPCLFCI